MMTKTVLSLLGGTMFLLLYAGCAEQPQQKEIFYVGTFSEEGLFVLEFDREERSFGQVQRVDDKPGPNFQAIHPNGAVLYSVSSEGVGDDDQSGSVAAYSINRQTGELSLLNMQPSQGRGPCHVSVDPLGRFIFVSNYGAGNLAVYPLREDGSIGEAVDVAQHEGSSVHRRQANPHMHSTIPSPDGRFIYASDLGIDRIMIYAVDQQTGALSPAETPYAALEPGSGPRHYTIHPNGNFAYSVDELSNTVAGFSVDRQTGALDPIQRIGMLPDGYEEESYAADIHISPDGRFLYATNRGHDSLAIFSLDSDTGLLELIGHEPTRGGHPRNFAIDSHGEFIFMTNRDNDNLVLFERDRETGLLTYTGVEVEIPRAICVTQHFLPN